MTKLSSRGSGYHRARQEVRAVPIREVARHMGEVVVLEAQAFGDERGSFMESYRSDTMRALGLPDSFVQENQSFSRRGVVRGLHFQFDPPMAKLMRVTQGRALLLAVDIRRGSPTLGRFVALEISAENRLQLFAPAGFARGFAVLSETAEVQYKCTALYNARGESGIRWNDPRIGIPWPFAAPILSPKDAAAQSLDEWLARPEAAAFTWSA